MSPTTVAQAFVRLAQARSPEQVDRLLSVLARYLAAHGKKDWYATVLRKAQALLEAEARRRGGIVVFGRAEPGAPLRDDARRILARMGAQGEPTALVDDTLVSGYVARYGSAQYDASGKRALLTLHQTLLSHSS